MDNLEPAPATPGLPDPITTAAAGAAPFLVTIGDIGCTDTLVVTPSGTIPLAQARFVFTDSSTWVRRTPPWAIVCAVVGFLLCLLGLLFLLIKEDKVTGNISVTVSGAGVLHTATIPVATRDTALDIKQRVDYANSLVHSQS